MLLHLLDDLGDESSSLHPQLDWDRQCEYMQTNLVELLRLWVKHRCDVDLGHDAGVVMVSIEEALVHVHAITDQVDQDIR